MTGITTHKISLISILETVIFLETNSSPEKNRRNQSCEKEAIVSRELKNRTFRKQHWRNEDLSLKLFTRVFCMKLVCLQYHNVERQPPSTLFSRYRSRQSVLLKTKKFETTWAGDKIGLWSAYWHINGIWVPHWSDSFHRTQHMRITYSVTQDWIQTLADTNTD